MLSVRAEGERLYWTAGDVVPVIVLHVRYLEPAVDRSMKGFFSSLPLFLLFQPARIEMPKVVKVSHQKSAKINNLPASWISTAEQIFCGTPSSDAPAVTLLLDLTKVSNTGKHHPFYLNCQLAQFVS